MLDLKFIRENKERVRRGIEAKLVTADLDQLLKLDQKKRELDQTAQELKARRNQANDEISRLKAKGESAEAVIRSISSSSQKISEIDKEVVDIDSKMYSILSYIPNIPHDSVPVGKDSSQNQVVREWGEKRCFSFPAKDHLELGKKLGWISFERGAQVTGSAFSVLQGKGARLERALINFMIDLHAKKHGYEEVWVPHLVNRQSMFGTGQLPKLEEEMYRLKEDDYFLIPTAEVPVTNLHRDETFAEKELPKKYVCYTPCFRREAGSYGKDTKGFSRVHQFDKVEMVKFVKPEGSLGELEPLVKDAEAVLQLLEIPYRVVLLCSADLSFSGMKGYDLEAWSSVSKKWYEVSSCTLFGDFQARRMNIRYRPAGGKKSELVHTLNGSGVALARTFLCLLENFQTAQGEVEIPKALKPYLD